VTAWACPGEFDPDTLASSDFELEWPPRSGRIQTFPELDEVRWCSPEEARRLLNPAQVACVERLESALAAARTPA
jgi:predicted NUDIX family NTP pyrophosphohydrolase